MRVRLKKGDYFRYYNKPVYIIGRFISFDWERPEGHIKRKIFWYDCISTNSNGTLKSGQTAWMLDWFRTTEYIRPLTKKEMMIVKDKRNEYVHPKKSKKELKKDALELIKRITIIIENEIVINAIPMMIRKTNSEQKILDGKE